MSPESSPEMPRTSAPEERTRPARTQKVILKMSVQLPDGQKGVM